MIVSGDFRLVKHIGAIQTIICYSSVLRSSLDFEKQREFACLFSVYALIDNLM